ncbi:MAG: hypothetical protein QJT81_02660 [Candidatus Thiothrix putei]|uniref:MORN repeat-containing protein n=1 Tax=Candidatus Thiothrix putei TaxID=3080811 RepID=A0AA95KQ67_9GAMM|nr:MAG: hypothetical protein QJT81_02660 [Candidatus Thiothrix putei]
MKRIILATAFLLTTPSIFAFNFYTPVSVSNTYGIDRRTNCNVINFGGSGSVYDTTTWSGDCPDEGRGKRASGKGISTLIHNGEIHYWFEGNMLSGKPHGEGILTYPDGTQFKGTWENGLATGYAEFVASDGSHYEGMWWNDSPSGGRTKYSEVIPGKGIFTDSNGGQIKGDFDSAWTCRGTYLYADGKRYEGYIDQGKRKGIGKLFNADGTLQYEGQWEDDKPKLSKPAEKPSSNASSRDYGEQDKCMWQCKEDYNAADKSCSQLSSSNGALGSNLYSSASQCQDEASKIKRECESPCYGK